MRYSVPWFALLFVAFAARMAPAQERAADPLAVILRPALRPTVATVLETHRKGRSYRDDDFPLPAERFTAFRDEIVQRLEQSLGLAEWAVRNPQGKQNALRGRFRDRLLKTITHHGVQMEVHVVEFPETGAVVPLVVCLPPGDAVHPGVCVFSGHSRHGLRDLVVDLDSYQRGAATRLARAGFVTVAVEKIDTGYLSRDGQDGVDENEIATFNLAWGRLTRAHQLMACLAAAEILAGHPRADETRIGATGVSLGGWLSVQTALLSDRIAAVADFGRKTVAVPPGIAPAQFRGMSDLCHIIPGMASVCDRNLLSLAWCPRPMLAGHGRKDTGSHLQGPIHYRQLFAAQYEKLGKAEFYEYHIHAGGDTMPTDAAIDYFRRQFNSPPRNSR